MFPLLVMMTAFHADPLPYADRAQTLLEQEEWTAAIDNADEAVRLDLYNPQRYIDRAEMKRRAGIAFLQEAKGLKDHEEERGEAKKTADDFLFSALQDASLAEDRCSRGNVRSGVPNYLRAQVFDLLAEYDRSRVDPSKVLNATVQTNPKEVADKALAEVEELNLPSPEATRLKAIQVLSSAARELTDASTALNGPVAALKAARASYKQAAQHYSLAFSRSPELADAQALREAARASVKEIDTQLRALNAELERWSDEIQRIQKELDAKLESSAIPNTA